MARRHPRQANSPTRPLIGPASESICIRPARAVERLTSGAPFGWAIIAGNELTLARLEARLMISRAPLPSWTPHRDDRAPVRNQFDWIGPAQVGPIGALVRPKPPLAALTGASCVVLCGGCRGVTWWRQNEPPITCACGPPLVCASIRTLYRSFPGRQLAPRASVHLDGHRRVKHALYSPLNGWRRISNSVPVDERA